MPTLSASTVFLVLDGLLAIACLFVFLIAFFDKARNGRNFALMLLSCGLLLGAYAIFLTADNQTLAFTAGCFCYALVDFAILSTLGVAFQLTGGSGKFLKTPATVIAAVFVFVDSLVFVTAPLTGIAGSCVPADGSGSIKWRAVVSPYHYVHTVICYFLVAYICYVVIRKALNTPKAYQNRYIPALLGIACIPVVNLLVLIVFDNQVDYSILLYGVISLFVYANGRFERDSIFAHGIQRQLLDEIGQSILLFDDTEDLVISNRDANLLVDKFMPRRRTLQAFMSATGISRTIPASERDKRRSFRWVTELAGEERSFRVDYRPLFDSKEQYSGTLFIFIDDYLETDVITGLSSKAVLMRWLVETEGTLPKPTSFITFDIDGLTTINNKAGREHGDRALRLLADTMRALFPPTAQFARLDEAMLLAIVPGENAPKTRTYATRVVGEMSTYDVGTGPLVISYAVSVATGDDFTPRAALGEATRALNVHKLLSQNSAHASLLDSLMQALFETGITTAESCERMALMARELGNYLGLSDFEQTTLALLCRLRDLGMVGVPLDIQTKPGELSDDEFELVKRHAFKGFRIANASDELRDVAPLILHHHERWDGKGYPDGLARESIPLLDRIVSVVEAYQALVIDRPYRTALTPQEALEEVQSAADKQFDPYIVACFAKVLEKNNYFDDAAASRKRVARADFRRPSGVVVKDEDKEVLAAALALVDHSHYLLDQDGRVIGVDAEFTRMTGYSEQDVEELRLHQEDLIFVEDRAIYLELCGKTFAQGNTAMIEHRIRRKDGEELFVLCVGKRNEEGDAGRVDDILIADIATTHMVSRQLAELQSKARRNVEYWENAARIDALTGIFNRNAFRNEVLQMLAMDDCYVAFGIVDADNFKSYNDTYGHPEGDELLKELAKQLESILPKGGVAGRMGGDEFAVALPFVRMPTQDDAAIQADMQRCYDQVAAAVHDNCRGATISMGLAVVEADILNFDEIYRLADQALYEAKEAGRANVKVNFTHE